jgi:hypothetical protein
MALRKRVNNLREIRARAKLSGYDLQILSSIPAQKIYLVERGLQKPWPFEKVALSKALRVLVEELFPKDLARCREIEGEQEL